jgi:hypothetical protein
MTVKELYYMLDDLIDAGAGEDNIMFYNTEYGFMDIKFIRMAHDEKYKHENLNDDTIILDSE